MTEVYIWNVTEIGWSWKFSPDWSGYAIYDGIWSVC